MPPPLSYHNGQFISGPLAVSVADAGFVFGATVTDLVRTFGHKLYRFKDHLVRFRRSCELCRVPLLIGNEEFLAAAEKLVQHNVGLLLPHPPAPSPKMGEGERIQGLTPPSPFMGEGGRGGEGNDLALLLLATPGPIGHYAGLPDSGPPTLMMHTFPLPFERYRRLFTDGATLVVPPTRPIPADCIDPQAKMRSRMHWWIAEQRAHDIDPLASALLVDAAGQVTEMASANFLIVKNGTVVTPPRNIVLNGVSLQVVEELCGELNIPFFERPLKIAECQSADEAMLTCTSYCVAGVRRLNGVDLPWPGPVWRRLLAAWSERLGVDIEARILS